MRRAAVLSAVLAIAGAGALADTADPTPLEWRLQTRRTGTEVMPKSGAPIYWTAAATTPVRGATLPWRLPRLRDPSRDRVRLIASGHQADLAVYVDVAWLETVARRRAIVTPGRDAAARPFDAKTPGIHIEPGTPLRDIERRRIWARVTVADEVISGRGFVRPDSLGIDFAPAGSTAAWSGERIGLSAGTALRQRPGGRIVARLAATLQGPREAFLLERRDRHALVACTANAGFTAVGWVERSRVRDAGNAYGTIGLGSYGTGMHRSAALQVGTVLRESKNGAVVGVMSRTTRVPLRAQEGEWMHVELKTALGDLDLWASSERLSLD